MDLATKRNIAATAQTLMSNGGLSSLISELKTKFALEIISTRYEDNTQREKLYMLSQLADEFAMKLQEYVNELNTGD